MAEKLKCRTIRLRGQDTDPDRVASAVQLLRDVKGVTDVRIARANRIIVRYNVRQITLQIIEALLNEFGYQVSTSLFCRVMRAFCYYKEDIECTAPGHDQAECTRDAFITRYLRREHGCRDHRPEYQKRYL